MKRIGLSIVLISISFFLLEAQRFVIMGQILDSKSNTPLIGVNVVLKKQLDTLKVYTGSTTDLDGFFKIENVEKDFYLIESTYLGYKKEVSEIEVTNKNINLGILKLTEDSKQLDEVLVKGKQIAVQIDGDTTQYNASSYKVNVDATAEDLLTKMPGITSDNGTLKVHGEEVQRVLIDGKPFFGDNPQTAIKNLPASIINKIMVFDDMNDVAKFSGFDDGNNIKTINIVTKNGISRSSFGRMHAGYGGPENRYDAGINYSNFNDNRRITILGISNNVNQQNFNMSDLMQASSITASSQERERSSTRRASGRMGSSVSNLMIDQQNGISTTHALGINYGDLWGKNKKVNVAGSYFMNISKNNNLSNSIRNYLSEADSGFVYTQMETENVRNINNRLNMRIEYNIDSFNSIFITPSLNIQYRRTNSLLDAENQNIDTSFINTISNNRLLKPQNISFDNTIIYRRRLEKKGRTISANITSSIQNRDDFNSLLSFNTFNIENIITNDTINQEADINRMSYSIEGGITYTEPVKETGQLSLSISSTYNKNNASRFTNNFNSLLQNYSLLDSALSNQFINLYNTHKFTAGYNYKNKNLDFNASLTAQIATLNSNQLFPDEIDVSRNFISVLPYFRLNYKISKTKNLRFFYRSRNRAPSINQLQNVIDNSNPLILSSGNENLKQDFSQSFGMGYNQVNTEKASSFFFFASATQTLNYIANTTSIIRTDTIIFNNEISSGTQFVRPVNLNGAWSARAYLLYGFPISKLKTNVSINSSFFYNRTPTLINETKNIANNYVLSTGITLASNISESVDFTLSYNTTYNIINNTLRQQNNNSFYNHILLAKLNYQFWKGFVFTTNTRNMLNAGGSSSFNTSFWLVDASIGYKFLKAQNLEVKFSTFDIFNQNRSIQRFVTEIYTEDIQTLALKRYYLATLTYTLKLRKDDEVLNMAPSNSGYSPHGFHHP
jgi:hypothetical protein